MLHEHLAAPLASSISNLEETDGNAGLLQLILTEVVGESEITPKAGSNFAAFVVSLSVENPKSLVKHLEQLSDIVESEVCFLILILFLAIFTKLIRTAIHAALRSS
jgi:hypothetical protein